MMCVTSSSVQAATRVFERQGLDIDGRFINVDYAEDNRERNNDGNRGSFGGEGCVCLCVCLCVCVCVCVCV